MSKKTRINLTIDQDVLQTAKALGLNISKVCENCLKDAIRRLTQPITATDGNGPFLSEKECSGRDLNPGRRLERPSYLTGLYYRSPNNTHFFICVSDI